MSGNHRERQDDAKGAKGDDAETGHREEMTCAEHDLNPQKE